VASVLIPADTEHGGPTWARLEREYAFEHLGLASSVPSHLAVLLRPMVARVLFDEALFDFDQVLSMERRQVLRSFHLPVSLSFEGDFRVRSFLAANVVGRIPGSGKRLGKEAVIVSAHYDHLGRGPAVDGDSIYNGVIDNAIGSAGLLELARVLMAAPERPRRTIFLLFTTAEEEGNLGAQFFLDHPPVPLSRIVANINIDGLAFRDQFTDVVGIGAELSDLGGYLLRAAECCGLEVSRPNELALGYEAFERSEQVVFAEAGIPAILINEGLGWQHHSRREALEMTVEWYAERYHSPSDDLEQPLEYSASRDHLALITSLVTMVANADLAPEWKAGVPYAYHRLLSIAEEERVR
jgi:Zn-dependent M28 family amino/carboxypeptidase